MSKSSFYSGTGLTNNDSNAIDGAKNAAEAARDAAQVAQAAAETAETNAETAAASVTTGVATATTKASEAATSATSAAASATTATTKASEASTSATAAATSATNAATSETSASTSASNASTSETNAASSAATVATQATNAATSASTASTQATNAASSATSAANSETNAATSETNAASSATTASTQASNAATSASTATTKAAEASTSASNASTSETNAASSATTASTQASNAASSASDAATSATNAASSATTASTQATNASTSATNAATSETNAASSATTASTQASNAATSATNAAASATTASTQASNAATSASTASTQASNAASSASTASAAQTAAEGARDSALAAFDSFDDRYLGVFSTAPTADNDGDSLAAGMLFFDSTASAMKVYTGSAWVAAYISGSDYLPLTGGTLTGAITFASTQTFDGRDVSADGSKLDGIEASADVTDAANVTAAGALMDSEITNLAQVKAFDASDYATAAQGTTADAALPKAGGTMTGDLTVPNIIVSGNVDGRDLSVDGTKLDGIETGATADQTKADIDALNIDADTVDSLHASSFLRSDANDTTTGTISAVALIGTAQSATSPSTDDGRFDGFGLQGNRTTNPVYVHNHGNGGVRISSNSVLGAGNGLLVKDTVTAVSGNLDVSNGVDVTGNITVSGTVDGVDIAGSIDQAVLTTSSPTFGGMTLNGTLTLGANVINDVEDIYLRDKIYHDGDTDTYFQFHAANQARIVCAGAEVMEWGNNYAKLSDNDTLYFGSGSDFQIYHNGTNNYIRNRNHAQGNIYIQGEDTSGVNHNIAAFYSANAAPYAGLYYDGTEVFTTVSGGVDVAGNLTADNVFVAGGLYHEGDTDTYLYFTTNQILLGTGGSNEVTITPTGVQLGDTGNGYFQPVSGNFGSIQIDGGAHGGYEGYSIGGRAVFMHNNGTATGIYDDVNNKWMFYGNHGASTYMYYNGSQILYTTSTGVTVNGDVNSTSDIRYKKNIEPIDNALEKVQSLKGVTFDWDNDAFKETEQTKKPEFTERATGVIAQDVEKVLPEAVRENEDGFKNVAYGNMVGLLIEAIKEQQTQIDELRLEVAELKG